MLYKKGSDYLEAVSSKANLLRVDETKRGDRCQKDAGMLLGIAEKKRSYKRDLIMICYYSSDPHIQHFLASSVSVMYAWMYVCPVLNSLYGEFLKPLPSPTTIDYICMYMYIPYHALIAAKCCTVQQQRMGQRRLVLLHASDTLITL